MYWPLGLSVHSSGQTDMVPTLGASSLVRETHIQFINSQNKYIISN